MRELVFATNNENKIREIEILLSGKFSIKKLSDIACLEELPETHDTIEENSSEKAEYIFNKFRVNCFSEDTGLEVDALNGEPGVYSARYAGEEKSADKNMDKVLELMNGVKDRSAQFKTVITLIINETKYQFTGILKGKIGIEKRGLHGFGYDPVFVIEDGRALAELMIEEKSVISHRGIATKKLITFLQNYEID